MTLDGQMAGAIVHAAHLRLVQAADDLSRLDGVAGDGDHGANMAAAFGAADARVSAARPSDAAEVFLLVEQAFRETGSGSAGALFGTLFGTLGRSLREARSTDPAAVVAALGLATDRVAALGRASAGDKTMLDALLPAVDAATAAAGAGATLDGVFAAASAAAARGAAATAGMHPRAGRARHAPEQATAVRDPGAVTIAIVLAAASDALSGRSASVVGPAA